MRELVTKPIAPPHGPPEILYKYTAFIQLSAAHAHVARSSPVTGASSEVGSKGNPVVQEFYITYFAINAYGTEVPDNAIQAADAELKAQLGRAYQVLAAKKAFEDAGGLQAFWRGRPCAPLLRWTRAIQAATSAAYQAEPPSQGFIPSLGALADAHVDVVAASRYDYTIAEWLQVFTAHYGMSDYCSSHQQSLSAGRRWLAISSRICPIAAADQEIRLRSHTRVRHIATSQLGTDTPAHHALIQPVHPSHHGAQR